MCNLYESTPRERINERFAVSVPPLPYAPQVAPLQPGPIVVQHGQAHVGQWGAWRAAGLLARPGKRAGAA